ncbi:MAG: hypothetical protein ACREXO_06425, partial [Advenella sp.]
CASLPFIGAGQHRGGPRFLYHMAAYFRPSLLDKFVVAIFRKYDWIHYDRVTMTGELAALEVLI